MENIYFNNIVKKKIIVNPKHMGNIDNYIETYLKNNYEGKCIAEGYVKPETIKIVRRSIGAISGSRFSGDVTYMIEYSAEICNPAIGNVIECKVKNINKLGLLCNNGPITVIVGKKFHDNLEDINKIKEGDSINVEIIAKKIQLNKEEIQVVGKIFSNNTTSNIKKNIKKTMVNSDITSIDVDEIPQNNVVENSAEFLEEENDYENKEEEEEVSYGSDEDEDDDEISSTGDIDDNMNFGDINIGENEDVENNAVEDDEDIEDDENVEDDEEVKEYDYD
jgi:DNA-directed RNA polymerase subunit E'/Rpb7